MSRNIIVIAAHPDDEILGCGGTLALHNLAGDKVYAAIACEGESLRYGTEGLGQKQHTRKAAKVIGIEEVRELGFRDQCLDMVTLTDLIRPIEEMIFEVQPSIVYSQYGGDINRDHELLFKAVLVAVRPMERCIEGVYAFDTASSTEWAHPRNFVPDTWIDISKTIELKLQAMACYKNELRDYPHPRSLEALLNKAKAWGNQMCMEHAEVFMTIRRSYRDGKTLL